MKKLYLNLRRCSLMFTVLLYSALTLASPLSLSAQSKVISGTVTDEQRLPVPGVSIQVKGTSKSTQSDSNGKYKIQADGNAEIVFTAIGFTTQTLSAGGNSILNVNLHGTSTGLNEVVVVGYGTQKKVNVIGSIATISAKSLENRPITNLSSGLAGLSAGIAVNQISGKPGSDGATIRIRGAGTLNNNNPLVIIDGIAGTMDAVNPNDVESMSLLKDAAAASIYGSLAANGVVLITTKKGTKNKLSVNYTSMFSVATPASMPKFVTDYITHMNLVNEGYRNLGQTPVYTDATKALWAAANADPDGLTAQGIPNKVAYPNTDWARAIFEHNLVQQHNISLNGGTENTQYLLSAGYLNNPGTMANTGTDRFQLRVNLQTKVNKLLTLGTQTFASLQNFGMASTANAFNFLRQTTPGVYPVYNGLYGFPAAAEESATANNISTYLYSTGGKDQESRFNTTVFANFDIYKGLSFETRFNYQTRFEEINAHSNTFEKWNFASNTLKVAATTPDQLSTSYYFNKDYSTTIDNVLRYNTTVAEKHDIGVLLGYNQNYFNYYKWDATKTGLIDASITTLGSATTMTSINGGAYDYSIRSFFGRLNYAYQSKYLLEGVFRYDGSSKFAPSNRWGFFPAFSAGWRISQEPFMKNMNDYVSNLKLRASWGKTGNNVMNTDAALGNYDYKAVYGSTPYSFNGLPVNGLIQSKFANGDLRWETTTVTNLGLDGSLFKGAVNFEVDLYNKFTEGILYVPTIPLTVGTATAATKNIAEISNKGLELTLGYNGKSGDFKYGVSGNFAYNFNRVKKYKGALQQGYTTDANGNQVYSSNLGSVSNGTITRILEGQQANQYYLYNIYKGNGSYKNADGSLNINGGPKDGMIRTPQDLAWLQSMVSAGYTFQPTGGAAGKTNITYGDLIYADNNGDGIYGNTYDQTFSNVSATPKYNFGLQLNFAYKGFDLSMLWAGSAGMKYYWNAGGYNSSIVSLGNAVSTLIANDHYYYNAANPSDPANNINAHYPRLKNTTDVQNSGVASDFYLYNASYVKLKNLQLGYTLSSNISKKAGMNRVRIYVSGENLFTITKFPGLDPELGITEGQYAGAAYPTMRQYTLGLNVTF